MIRSLPRFLVLLALAPLGAQAAPELPLPAQAVARIGSPQVIASPDRADWTYLVGQPIAFKVTVLLDDMPLPGATIRYRVGPEKLEGDEVAVTSADGTFTIPGGKLDQPGFVRCLIQTEVLGKTYEGVATAAVEPTKITPTQTDPADFDAFWQDALTEQASKPLRVQ